MHGSSPRRPCASTGKRLVGLPGPFRSIQCRHVPGGVAMCCRLELRQSLKTRQVLGWIILGVDQDRCRRGCFARFDRLDTCLAEPDARH